MAGCRGLVVLHDEQGHPLLVTTHRGDLHLRQSVPQVLTSYEQVTETMHLNHLVVDHEARAVRQSRQARRFYARWCSKA